MTCANGILPTFMETLQDWSQSHKVTQFYLLFFRIGTKQNCSLTKRTSGFTVPLVYLTEQW